MRGILLTASSLAALAAQNRGAVISREFTVSDSPCGYRHDPDVEKALRALIVNAGPAATLELRNATAKPITAFILTTRRGPTGWYGASGEDFIYDLASGASTPFPPGGVLHKELGTGRNWEVFPCAVLCDDGGAVGADFFAKFVGKLRLAFATGLAGIISELESAGSTADPRAALASRVRQLKRRGAARSSYGYLELVVSKLSGADVAGARKIIAEHVSTLRAEREGLARLGVTGAPDRTAPAPAARW